MRTDAVNTVKTRTKNLLSWVSFLPLQCPLLANPENYINTLTAPQNTTQQAERIADEWSIHTMKSTSKTAEVYSGVLSTTILLQSLHLPFLGH